MDYPTDRNHWIQQVEQVASAGERASDTFIVEEGDLAVALAPFVPTRNAEARLILLGLTPGRAQADAAWAAARAGFRRGLRGTDLLDHIREVAAFKGAIRRNLVSMLDNLGVNEVLGVATCLELLEHSSSKVAVLSLLPNPVYKRSRGKWTNYSGYGPKPKQCGMLRTEAERWSIPVLQASPKALVVAMGGPCQELLAGTPGIGTVLHRFPHPSPANGHRTRLFEQHRHDLRTTVRSWAGT